MQTRYRFLVGLFLLFSLAMLSTRTQATEKWNVLLVTADDMNADSSGWMGNQLHLTPNLDDFARTAHRFVHHHVTVPICQPGRSAFMTGLVPHRNGALGFQPIRPGVPTLTKILRDAGWYTAVIDKHPHMKPDESFPWHSKFTGSGKNPKLFGEHLQQCIQEAKELKLPFFINANITDPHRPFRTNDDAAKKTNNQGKKRANQKEADHSLPMVAADTITVPSFLEELPEVRQEVAEYYSSIRRFDASFGEAMMALQQSGQASSTVVLFLSDHGMSFPFSKATVYRNGTWSPVLLRWPGMQEPQTHAEWVSSVDILPTLLDILQLPYPSELSGRTWVPLLEGKTQPDRDFVVTHVNTVSSGKSFPQRCVRSEKYAYQFHAWPNGKPEFRVEAMSGRTFNAMSKASQLPDATSQLKQRVQQLLVGETEQFFDLESDPDERINRIADPRFREAIQLYRQRLENHMLQSQDPLLETFRSTTATKESN